jgi:hypothetical protein
MFAEGRRSGSGKTKEFGHAKSKQNEPLHREPISKCMGALFLGEPKPTRLPTKQGERERDSSTWLAFGFACLCLAWFTCFFVCTALPVSCMALVPPLPSLPSLLPCRAPHMICLCCDLSPPSSSHDPLPPPVRPDLTSTPTTPQPPPLPPPPALYALLPTHPPHFLFGEPRSKQPIPQILRSPPCRKLACLARISLQPSSTPVRPIATTPSPPFPRAPRYVLSFSPCLDTRVFWWSKSPRHMGQQISPGSVPPPAALPLCPCPCSSSSVGTRKGRHWTQDSNNNSNTQVWERLE